MNAIPPSIPERLHLLGLARDVVDVAIFHIAARGGPLEVRIELDPVRRIDINALHLPPQALPLGQRRHHLQAVAEDHAVGPVGVVLVELGLRVAFGHAVEVGEEVDTGPPTSVPAALRRSRSSIRTLGWTFSWM